MLGLFYPLARGERAGGARHSKVGGQENWGLRRDGARWGQQLWEHQHLRFPAGRVCVISQSLTGLEQGWKQNLINIFGLGDLKFFGVIWLGLVSSVQLLIDAVRNPRGTHPWTRGWSAGRGARDQPGASQWELCAWGLLWLPAVWDANGNWDSDGNCGSWLPLPSCHGDDGCAGAPGHLPTQLLRHSTVGKNSNNWLLLHGGKQEYLHSSSFRKDI